MKRQVTGPRSPNWAFMQKTTIPCRDGLLYLVRWRIVQTPWFAIYLHDIFEPDEGRDPHDHPWTFWSLVLRGGYIEEVWDRPQLTFSKLPWRSWSSSQPYKRRWLPGTIHKMTHRQAHIIRELRPGTKTLIFCGRRRREWGFYTDEGWVSWKRYHHQ